MLGCVKKYKMHLFSLFFPYASMGKDVRAALTVRAVRKSSGLEYEWGTGGDIWVQGSGDWKTIFQNS